ncbi:tripartite tricarboxylate transporter substrate binding protein [Paenibacillus sp. HB172176]|uniref:tripartite tricarboxylate transporter substrate binding protein n=1 Tax=Paenibacillus sp. HB172176 TaxID=2493690 RepID=UPI00143AF216|nr:tripartite tricarboxylate transporter substrate binding protein [Paenibacillus sp. HB172176]
MNSFGIKKISFISMLIVIAFSLAACGSNGDGGNQKDNGGSNQAAAASFPEKEVKMVVAFGAGGTLDLAPRAMAESFKEITGQSLVIENHSGGAGIPGTMDLVNAEPDGYTISMIPSGQLSLRPALQPVDYSFPDDFTPIVGVGDFEIVFAALSDAPYNNMTELVDYYKDKNEEVKISTSGVNTYSHLLAAMLSKETGAGIRHLPFEGNAEAVTALLGKHTDIVIVNLSNVAEQIKAGTVKVLGVPAKERYSNFPDAPTLKEQGINVVGGATFAIYGPAGMPEDVVQKLHDVFLQTMESKPFQEFATNTSLLLTKTEPENLIQEISEDRDNIEAVKENL